jgi:hypothetical protein
MVRWADQHTASPVAELRKFDPKAMHGRQAAARPLVFRRTAKTDLTTEIGLCPSVQPPPPWKA